MAMMADIKGMRVTEVGQLEAPKVPEVIQVPEAPEGPAPPPALDDAVLALREEIVAALRAIVPGRLVTAVESIRSIKPLSR